MKGLILAGGKSTRMGSPKAELAYHAQPEHVRLSGLLNSVCESVYLSVSDYWRPSSVAGVELLEDLKPSKGPLSGLSAAFAKEPKTTFVVLACDMPFFDAEALNDLMQARDATSQATCFSLDGITPEPLCAIYEPSAAHAIRDALSKDIRCARRVMQSMQTKLVRPRDTTWLRNLNSKDDFDSFSSPGPLRELEVTYVAMLREAAGKDSERIATRAKNAKSLYEDLRGCYAFTLKPERMRVAVNDVIVPWSTPLNANDRIMFVPPVAGG